MKFLATGIILIRLAGLSMSAKSDILATTIQEHGAELFSAFTVVAPTSIRIRKL
jgi:hypothetical protein